MAKPKKELVKIPVANWCTCENWRDGHWQLANLDKMNFCIFCGKKLVKEKIV
jgi:hypothetical protein